jgi:hypothetical protein
VLENEKNNDYNNSWNLHPIQRDQLVIGGNIFFGTFDKTTDQSVPKSYYYCNIMNILTKKKLSGWLQ